MHDTITCIVTRRLWFICYCYCSTSISSGGILVLPNPYITRAGSFPRYTHTFAHTYTVAVYYCVLSFPGTTADLVRFFADPQVTSHEPDSHFCARVVVCVKGKGAHQAAAKCELRKRATMARCAVAIGLRSGRGCRRRLSIQVVASANFKNKTTVSGGHRHDRVCPTKKI